MAHKSTLKLGIIASDLGARGPSGQLMVNHAIARLLEAIRGEFPQARLCLPILPAMHGSLSHPLDFPDEAITALPPLASTMQAQRYWLATSRQIREMAATCDALMIRIPFQIPRALRKLNKPKVVQVVGDPLEVVRSSTDYKGLMRFAARSFASDMMRVTRSLIAEPRTRAVTHGQELWRRLNCHHGRSIVSSCLLEEELDPRTDFQLSSPPRILFVGYLRPEKGVHDLLEAFKIIRQKREATLTLVGGTDRDTMAGQLIQQQIDSHPNLADIKMRGLLRFGPDLFEAYRSHDVYVLPSLSEGTPRTLVEARAFGCPTVATTVGGIPNSIQDGHDGLLVPPSNPQALAEAILRLLEDQALRQRLIQQGLTNWGGHTVQRMASEIAEEVMLAMEMGEPAGLAAAT